MYNLHHHTQWTRSRVDCRDVGRKERGAVNIRNFQGWTRKARDEPLLSLNGLSNRTRGFAF